MLDEEVLLKTNRNTGETMSVFYAVAAVCVPAFMLGGDSAWGVGALIALGILAPINLYHSVSNWRTVRDGASWKFPLLLLPYIAMFIITVVAVLNPVVESVYVSGKEWIRLSDNPDIAIVSGTLSPVYPITSVLAILSAAACGMSIYFVVTSKFVFRRIFLYCSLFAGILALIGFVIRAVAAFAHDSAVGFGAEGFSLFPDSDSWCGFAIIWQGAALAAAVYSAQRFAVEHVLCSLRFWAIVFAMLLWGSVQICGVSVERFLATVVLVAGIFALALDVFPSKSNLKKYKIGRMRGGFSIKLRGKIPFIVYVVALAALLFLAWKQYGVCGGAESLSFDPAAEFPLTDRQIKAYDEDFKEMTANRTMFGWGESSFTTVFSFFQGDDLGGNSWDSPKSDLQRCLAENGYAGLAIMMVAPALFLLGWLFRLKISLPSFVLGATIAIMLFLGCVRNPFENVAVVASFMVVMYSFFGWDTSEG